MTRRISVGDTVVHFKRELMTEEEKKNAPTQYFYHVEGFAIHSETREKMVVYRAMYDDFGLYVRPFSMFMSEVDKEKYPKVKSKYRFTAIVSEGV